MREKAKQKRIFALFNFERRLQSDCVHEAYKVNVIQIYSDRQHDCDHAAFFAAFQYFYLSVMLSDNFTDKCKPQAGTSHSTAS